MGAEYSYAAYSDKDHNVTSAVTTIDSKVWALEAVARYVFLPEKQFNPYFIGGIGVGQVSANAKSRPTATWPDLTTGTRTNYSGNATGPAFSLGAGFDGSITDSVIAGLEVRWRDINAQKTFSDQITPGLKDHINSSTGLIVAAKIGFKFGH